MLGQMCGKLSEEHRLQFLPCVSCDLKYFLDDPAALQKTPLKNMQPAHPNLAGLVVVNSSGKKFRTVEKAVKSENLSASDKKEVDRAALAFYQNTLGVDMSITIHHELLGKGYKRQWKDSNGETKEVYGCIEKCKKDRFSNCLNFSVGYDEDSLRQLKALSFLPVGVPSCDEGVSEEETWGGYYSYLRECDETDNLPSRNKTPFNLRYIVPTTDRVAGFNQLDLPVRVLYVKGFRLELKAERSEIAGAGLGLFLTCTPLSPVRKRKVLQLSCGEMVDLGVYAPNEKLECKSEHILLLKDFVHSHACESWSYESLLKDHCEVFDITDDQTGLLRDAAKKNIIVYTNETDGINTPSICAGYDPEGAVHYYLGHRNEGDGPLHIQADGSRMELKIDYGTRYEKVRVMKGYPRIEGGELKEKQAELEQDDADIVRTLRDDFSFRDISDSVDFLRTTFGSYTPTTADEVTKVERALISALALHQRLKEIDPMSEILEEDSTSNTSTKSKGMEGRLGRLVLFLCGLFPGGYDHILACIRSEDLFRSVVVESLGFTSTEILDLICSEVLQRKMEEAVS